MQKESTGNKMSVLSLVLFAAGLYLLEEAQASYVMSHPQKLFCDADYVFKFRAMAMGVDRTKRGLAAGGKMKSPKNQMVEVERIYKGKKMMMPMMKLARDTNDPHDTFAAATKIEARIQLGWGQNGYKSGEKCVFFGKMYRYRNNTMMPSSDQVMMANIVNTIPETRITKVMRRGLRRKYAKGCKQGCQVKTVYWETSSKSKDFCFWNVNEFRPPKIDCRKTTQFCARGKDGFCQWKGTKAFMKCVKENIFP